MTKREYRDEMRMWDESITHARKRIIALWHSEDPKDHKVAIGYEESIKEVENFIAVSQTDYFVSAAHRKYLYCPPQNDDRFWMTLPPIPPALGGRRVLTKEGHAYIKKEMRELLQMRINIISLSAAILTGVIGSLIGLVSILQN